jgi:hypothetical protein
MSDIHVKPEDVALIISATFPDYTGKKVRVTGTESVTLHNLEWSGGSRSLYRACTIDGVTLGAVAHGHIDNPAEGAKTSIALGCAIVEHITFCGRDLGLRIYVRPDDMPKNLAAPADALAPYETLILYASRAFKSSYGGQDRYQMARADYRARDMLTKAEMAYPSREQWEQTKAALIAKGFLDKRGALTIAGRNQKTL